MKWIKYCKLFSLLYPWGKCGSFGLSLGVCPTEHACCSLLSGCLCLVEDERLREYVISDGSAIGRPLGEDPGNG